MCVAAVLLFVGFLTCTKSHHPQQHLRSRQSERHRQEAVNVLSLNSGATVTNKWAEGQSNLRDPVCFGSFFFFFHCR